MAVPFSGGNISKEKAVFSLLFIRSITLISLSLSLSDWQKSCTLGTKIQKRNELHRQQIIDEIKRIRNTPKENGKYPTYREIEMMTGVSRQEIGDILNGKANARYLSKRIKI